ncbi:MAG: major facilitator superfamily domain-containing protein [Benniella sp.]|nr:MAG: major facilitator superfamily domain-containing protein [Benniella sp.]
MTSSSEPSGHPETSHMTPASELPSTLAMAFENPSSTSLALSSGITLDSHHHHHDIERNSTHLHPDRRSKAPSVISEKFEGEQDRTSTDVGEDETTNEKRDSSSLHKIQKPAPDMEGKILDYPEGGFGWLVVLASFVVNFWAFGPNITYGVYQNYFRQADTFVGAAQTQLSWVGSIGTAAMFIPGPFVAPMTRILGLRSVVAIGILIASVGFILASFATELWQLYLTQGFMFGFGGGIVFFSSISVTAQYFEKRRGLANGIAVAGSGIGGLALAPLTRLLIEKVGIRWCQRIIGFCILGFMAAIFPFIKPRVRPVKKGAVFDFSLFKVPGFLWLLLTAFIVTFGYMVPIFLIPTYASEELHQPDTTGANLISLFSAINAVSRIGLGVAADKLGRTNTLFTCCVLAGVSCLAIWSVASNIQILTFFMVFYGLFGGGFISIFPVVVAQVVGVERLSAALGILYFGNVVGNLLGAPIASAIRASQDGKYLGAILFAGFTPVLAATFVLFVRFRINKKIFAIA